MPRGDASSHIISPDTIELGKELGRGAFGVVYKGTYEYAPAAIKQLLLPSLTPKDLQLFRQEGEIMAKLKHPYVIQLFGFTDAAPYSIVMEFMPNGSLFDVLHSERELSWTERLQWGMEVGSGLNYLHNQTPKILHRDLKSLNVLVGKDQTSKLTDFGLALSKLRTSTKTLTSSKKRSGGGDEAVGSLRWMAPELLGLKPKYSVGSDIYAYGMVLWELASREIPYASVFVDSIIQGAVASGEREDVPEGCPVKLASLIQGCWSQDTKVRLPLSRVIGDLQSEVSSTEESAESAHDDPVASRGYAWGGSSGGGGAAAAVPGSRGYGVGSVASVGAASGKGPGPMPSERFSAPPIVKSRPSPKAPVIKLDQKAVNQFVQHVALGQQDEAEAMLKQNPRLSLGQGTCTDHAGRTFKDITGFQYALWALDWHMWDMILPYLSSVDSDAAREQFEHQESVTSASGHGARYHYQELLDALQTYIDRFPALYSASNWDELERLWIRGVGGAQSRTVAHVAQEYCHPDRPFDPVPDFTKKPFPRQLKTDEGDWWTAKYNNGPLGGGSGSKLTGFGAWRAGVITWTACVASRAPHVAFGASALAIAQLVDTRLAQLEELKASVHVALCRP